MTTEHRTQFDYLLNALENAAQEAHPAKAGYAGKRKALFAYVRELESRASPPVQQGVVEALETALEVATEVLQERKLAMAGWPRKWEAQQRDVDQIRAALASLRPPVEMP